MNTVMEEGTATVKTMITTMDMMKEGRAQEEVLLARQALGHLVVFRVGFLGVVEEVQDKGDEDMVQEGEGQGIGAEGEEDLILGVVLVIRSVEVML